MALLVVLMQVVYKGRKKKTIQYFAVKSVEKLQKPKVLQEVRITPSCPGKLGTLQI